MPKKKNISIPEESTKDAEIALQPITQTIEKNYMPYVMSVIISRAIPEIDGFKPAHRKLLYTMYKMDLLNGPRTKSANVVGQTMKLNPHGDASIYETMVRLTRGNESLLHPFVDSKGSFGKQYSRDMAYAASRYTEVKLDTICKVVFDGINKDAVDFTDNYDNTMKEPLLLPVAFPNILVSANSGIAVGMASTICSFNLAEICDGTIELIKNSHLSVDKLLDIIKAPDFPGGGIFLYNREKLKEIYQTGRGTIKLRSRYRYDKENNCIEIIEIPYTTSLELIMKKIADGVKDGKIKEITDYRDEIDIDGFKLTLDLRKGVDPDNFMLKLFNMTPLEETSGCNFNVLIDGTPRVMGIIEILSEWLKFRTSCLKREFIFDLNNKKDKLHLLLGLGKILLDIDKAIAIVRNTENEADVVPNLSKAFDIDTQQAEYVAEIKLRHLNREYILNRVNDISNLQKEIAELEELISDDKKIKAVIAKQLKEIKEKYAKPRKTLIVNESDIKLYKDVPSEDNYNVKIILTREGYFKKTTLQSLRGNDEHKLKDNDEIIYETDAENINEIIIFTDKAHIYRAKLSDFDNTKASMLGDYLPAKLSFDDGEKPLFMMLLPKFDSTNMIYIFENGKGVKIPLSLYETKSPRRKLTGVFSTASAIIAIFYEKEPINLVLSSSGGKSIMINSSLIPTKSTKSASGVTLFSLKKGEIITSVEEESKCKLDTSRLRKTKIPATGIKI